jgi:hypothetical protein
MTPKKKTSSMTRNKVRMYIRNPVFTSGEGS